MQPFYEFLVRWSQADVSAVAYAMTHAGSEHPEHAFLAQQLRVVAERWNQGLLLEIRHMQQRMPRFEGQIVKKTRHYVLDKPWMDVQYPPVTGRHQTLLSPPVGSAGKAGKRRTK